VHVAVGRVRLKHKCRVWSEMGTDV
jgi:hypothetical protein